ncbi:MAG: DUF370 domain-containing protein [Selenomonadaceae bacterium]|nr:DUF370 domain-containing protein [Selenomonadaceae bacterium]
MAKMVNVGYSNMVSVDRIIAVMTPEAAQTKRVVARAKNEGKFLDASHGRRTRSVVILDSGHVVSSGYTTATISEQISRNELAGIRERDEKDDNDDDEGSLDGDFRS